MSRELKFKSWNGVGMSKPFTLQDVMRDFSSDPDDDLFLQYIGISDKNGIEVYEGDICQEKYGHRFIIEYDIYQFKPDRSFGTLNGIVSELEVIGNIHENPELLKGKP